MLVGFEKPAIEIDVLELLNDLVPTLGQLMNG